MRKRAYQLSFMTAITWAAAVAAATASSCHQDFASGEDGAESGQLALTTDAADDVAGFGFEIRGEGGMVVASRFVATGPMATTVFILRPGEYSIRATPMSDEGVPAPGCAFAIASATVTLAQTTDVMLVVPCEGVGAGGLRISARTDPAPVITGLSFDPPTAVGPCEQRRITVTATDPTNEPIDYFLGVGGGDPTGAVRVAAHGDGNFDFSASRPGVYDMEVRACDPHFGCPRLFFTLEVKAAPPGSEDCVLTP